MRAFCVTLLLAAWCLYRADAFYLPGVAPQDYEKVRGLGASPETRLSIGMPICKRIC